MWGQVTVGWPRTRLQGLSPPGNWDLGREQPWVTVPLGKDARNGCVAWQSEPQHWRGGIGEGPQVSPRVLEVEAETQLGKITTSRRKKEKKKPLGLAPLPQAATSPSLLGIPSCPGSSHHLAPGGRRRSEGGRVAAKPVKLKSASQDYSQIQGRHHVRQESQPRPRKLIKGWGLAALQGTRKRE